MMAKASVVRVRPLLSFLDGQDPKNFIHGLLVAGYDRFYVKVPSGFVVSIWPIDPCPPGHQFLRAAQPSSGGVRPAERHRPVCYLQLDKDQLRDIVEHPPIALHQLKGGYLQAAENRAELFSIEYEYREGLPGVLLPKDCAIADRLSMELDVRSVRPSVVRILNSTRSNYSYVLCGLAIDDLYIEESALLAPVEPMSVPRKEPVSQVEDALLDPYALKESSPLVYEILCKAYTNRDRPKGELNSVFLAPEFRLLNTKYADKNPMPFKDGREHLAACLSNPGYKSKRTSKPTPPFPVSVIVPPDVFLHQGFINKAFRDVLYAACCWADRMEPSLGKDLMRLVDLLRGLGFRDARADDPVQQIVYFIVGDLVPRCSPHTDYRDIEG